ncbi:hypothetical protein [Nonomuraea guangzhouensis]|uniref:Uncharacterized protein n=1 Tax=Nonomuraea guangzhouensis TaxID=1291555 RepID=A0ABW4G412_9ACTN|nr:hypothetical protein [Nonomuraea guangzhouensis]
MELGRIDEGGRLIQVPNALVLRNLTELENADAVLADTLAMDVDFIVPELTMATRNPAMSHLIPLHEAARQHALDGAASKAKAVAARFAA